MFMIKSSVALSLGLVGALSIVRFRAAIKDPEELAYILFIIAIGLGFGSSQKGVTILGVLILLPTLYIKGKFFDKVDQEKSVFLDLNTSETESKNVMEKVDEVFLKYSIAAELKRIDQSKEGINSTFKVTMKDTTTLSGSCDELCTLLPNTKVSIVDNSKPLSFS